MSEINSMFFILINSLEAVETTHDLAAWPLMKIRTGTTLDDSTSKFCSGQTDKISDCPQ